MSIRLATPEFQHIVRVCNTNLDGRQKIIFALRAIKGIGRRFATLICKKCDIDTHKRAGEITQDEIQKIVSVISNPLHFRIPAWFLNRQKDFATGKDSQVYANFLDGRLRDDIERMKKIRLHKGLRHFWCVKVRGQHTKTCGRGRSAAMAAKK